MKKFIACLLFIILFFVLIPNIDTCANNDINKDDPIYILGIGNSHTRSSYSYLYKIFKKAGYTNIIIGKAYIYGSTMQSRYMHFRNNDNSFTYYLYKDNKRTKYKNMILSDIIKSEKWNYIILQQNSYRNSTINRYTSKYNTKYRCNISKYIDDIQKINSYAKIGLMIPWSKSDNTMKTQYNNLQSTALEILDYEPRIEFSINIGKYVQLARKNKYLKSIGNNLLRKDNTHLERGIPIFLASYTIAKNFGVSYEDLSWYPTTKYDKKIKTKSTKSLANRVKRLVDKY